MNQLQEQLRAIENTITALKKQKRPNKEKIEALTNERNRILKELGVTEHENSI